MYDKSKQARSSSGLHISYKFWNINPLNSSTVDMFYSGHLPIADTFSEKIVSAIERFHWFKFINTVTIFVNLGTANLKQAFSTALFSKVNYKTETCSKPINTQLLGAQKCDWHSSLESGTH